MAPPRWPTITFVSGLVITLVMVPVVAQLAFRLLTAMEETSFLLGADPTRADQLRAAAGVAGGGITTALAVAALGIVRGRVGYVVGAVAVVLLFVVFPYLGYTANAGIVAAPVPTLEEMLAPQGWDRAGQLRVTFWLAAGAFLAAVLDLLYRSATALRAGLKPEQEG